MENKKQLIIIPPMSEAVKKLHEVLEGIAVDENMEISLIDDLKELQQFVTSTGQCIILASNAKKCATFLQDNRGFLLKNHCKTILFTPKEIPAKTLVKFTKIGLTESILESSPPKTFLYKVKLLLRSIKVAKPQDDAEKTVKSLDVKATESAELEMKEKARAEVEENVIDMERPKKNDAVEGDAIDYGNPLKGKVRPQEESIDTHWKSNRKKSEAVAEAEEGNMSSNSEVAEIDMYYRGKQKKTDALEPEEDDFDRKMAELMAAEEEAKKRKSNYEDVIDEGSMKQKRLDQQEEYTPEENKIDLVELDLEPAAKKKSKQANEEEEDDQGPSIKLGPKEEAQAASKDPHDSPVDDLGGYLKGKITQIQEVEEEPEIELKKEYDNSALDEKEKDPLINLDLEPGAKKKNKKNDEEEALEDNVHEGEVDQIEGNMIGDESTVDKIRTRMEGRSSYEEPKIEEDAPMDPLARKKKQEEELDDFDRKMAELMAAEKEAKERQALRSDEEPEDYRERPVELDLIAADKKPLEKRAQEEAEEKQRRALDPVLEKEAAERKQLEKTPEAEKKGREFEEQSPLAKEREHSVHDGAVDKIDTFYRGGESAKKVDQGWGNLDKKTSLDLLPGKGKRTDGTVKAEKEDLGEQTIDYRKMKEEFDMINDGVSAAVAAGRTPGDTTLKNDEDEGSFKVVEIDPKSLDFSISILNSIYLKETKPKVIFAQLADELINNYHCYPVFYTYKLSDKKFTEAFNPYSEIRDNRMDEEKRAFWNEFKKDTALFEHFQEKSMTTWRCAEIVNDGVVWEDVELPSWAENELKTKKVELIFPYFDGIDRMGMAVVLFPEGLDPKSANGLLTVLEMARTLFLDTIQRYQVQPIKESREEAPAEAPVEEKNKVLSFFGGLFGKKKAG